MHDSLKTEGSDVAHRIPFTLHLTLHRPHSITYAIKRRLASHTAPHYRFWDRRSVTRMQRAWAGGRSVSALSHPRHSLAHLSLSRALLVAGAYAAPKRRRASLLSK